MSNARYLSCAETAVLMRVALKTAFPRSKFSVISKTYSGGASINVKWTDGPRELDVDRVAGRFSGAGFDSMQDMKTYNGPTTLPTGEVVRFGADYVFTVRHISPAAFEVIDARLSARFGVAPFNPEGYIGGEWGHTWRHRELRNRYFNPDGSSFIVRDDKTAHQENGGQADV